MVPHHKETLVLILISCNVVNHSLGVDDQEAVSVEAADLGQLIKGSRPITDEGQAADGVPKWSIPWCAYRYTVPTSNYGAGLVPPDNTPDCFFFHYTEYQYSFFAFCVLHMDGKR